MNALSSALTLSELALDGETKNVDSKELRTRKLTVTYWRRFGWRASSHIPAHESSAAAAPFQA